MYIHIFSKLTISTNFYIIDFNILSYKNNASFFSGPGSSVGCASTWHASVAGSILGSNNFLSWKLAMNHCYCHSFPTADSSRAVVSYRRNYVHLVLVKRLGSLPRTSVVRITGRLNITIVVDWDVKPQINRNQRNTASFFICNFSLFVRDIFRLMNLLIKIVFAAILSGRVVMLKCLEQNDKIVFLGHTAFFIGLFQISVYMWPPWHRKSEKQPFCFISGKGF